MENKTDKDNISLIQKTLDSGTYSQIRRMLNKLQAADIAHFIESSPPEERDFVWKILDKEIDEAPIEQDRDNPIAKPYVDTPEWKALHDMDDKIIDAYIKHKEVKEKAPPGREDQVKALKKKFKDKSAPYAIAWAQHNKHGKPKNEAELEEGKIKDETSPRVSVGFGVQWKSPFGPVRVDFAHAVIKEDFDRTQFLKFNFGAGF